MLRIGRTSYAICWGWWGILRDDPTFSDSKSVLRDIIIIIVFIIRLKLASGSEVALSIGGRVLNQNIYIRIMTLLENDKTLIFIISI